jgi:signal transduction histidine kinase
MTEAAAELRPWTPLLGDLCAMLPCGVVAVDRGGELVFASQAACTLLGALDEPGLRAQWPRIAPMLGLDADGTPPGGESPVRLELHAFRQAGLRVMLMKPRNPLDDADAALVAASRSQAQDHVIAGLLHDVNGPLNNVSLTLSLLESAMGRLAHVDGLDELAARCRRYVDVLRTESARLVQWTREAGSAVHPGMPAGDPASLAELLGELQRMLRHHATLCGVSIEVGVIDPMLQVAGDGGRVRLALLDFLMAAIGFSAAGGRIAVSCDAGDDSLRLCIDMPDATLPADAQRWLCHMLATPPADAWPLVAGRLLIEEQGGSSALSSPVGKGLRVDIRLPRHSKHSR